MVATVSGFLTVGVSVEYESTVNSDFELTVATTAADAGDDSHRTVPEAGLVDGNRMGAYHGPWAKLVRSSHGNLVTLV